MTGIVHGQFYRHRRIDKLALVLHSTDYIVRTVHVDYSGFRMPRAHRSVPIPLAKFVKDFQLYRPCRWALDCHAQAVDVVHHQDHGDIDVCVEHGAEHAEWRAQCAVLPRGRWLGEHAPDCDCPDFDGGRMVVDYCCTHGTPEQRGHEFIDSLAANLAVFAQFAAVAHASDGGAA